MFGSFTEDVRKILVGAKMEMHELRHPYVGSEHLLLSILKNNNVVSKKLQSHGLNYDNFKSELINIVGVGTKESTYFLYTPLLKRVLEGAIIDSKENNNEVSVENLFISLLDEGEGIAIRILIGMNIDIDKIYKDFNYRTITKKKKNKKLLLEELGTDLTLKAINGELDPVVGRDKEIKRVLEILSRRTKNNPILVGEAGVGKTAIVEGLSTLIANGEVPNSLKNKRIISLDMASAVAGTKYRGEFEERIRKILKEIEENDDIILFIDEVHTLVGAGGAEGAIDASNIFKPALARGKLKCIGATTLLEYKKYIEEDGALERRFQKVFIEVPNDKTVKEILMKLKPIYEKFHNVKIEENIIDDIIMLSNSYIYDRNQPDKAIDILDEVCAKANLNESADIKEYNILNKELKEIVDYKNNAIINNKFAKASKYKLKENELMNQINNLEIDIMNNQKIKYVTKEDVAEIINIKTKIPIYEIVKDNVKQLSKVENAFHDKIKGEDKVIKELMNIIKRIKLGFKDESKCYSIMFTGSTGTGKTELAKLFGKELVGKENVIKLDMSEFGEAHSISKIVGAPPGYVGYSDNKNVLEDIRNKPYSVLILDEIEKAHPNIINLLFQIFDEGKLKDSKGNTVRFDNIIVIMTSNIGYNNNSIGFSNKEEATMSKLKEYFSIPFINRIDNIIMFDNLNEDIITSLVKIKINSLIEKYKTKKITVKINKNIINEIIKESNYKELGARKIDKIIKNKLDILIIDEIVKGKKEIDIKTLDNLVSNI